MFVCLLVFQYLYSVKQNIADMVLRPYSKSELAQAYAPDITVHAAVNRLMAWIKLNEPLYEALKQHGYVDNRRLFTVRQVELIFEYLGEP